MRQGRGRQPEQRSGKLRCAIYTRKSTEEGLDQEFNSLDAQREACAAYILSQRHEGWTLLPERYDDGGFSGGNMERPGLKRLLAAVQAGRVDVIVVYKVDRLTRALSDFAKIVDTLDAAEASFVSITQAFNTTTSMGRLTLNVLLSFAQFEREVISERVRDKIAASKAKGMWMGGTIPLGYDVYERKLVPNEAEAETVRHIMRRYLKLGSVRELVVDLSRSRIVTKRQQMRDGSIRGGLPFARGPLYHLLKNRIYRGDIVHHDKVHPGEHDAIVDEAMFDAVQATLAANIEDRRSGKQVASPSILTGMIRDAADRPLSPSHAVKAGKRYRYYVSNEAAPGDAQYDVIRLPAPALEAAVVVAVRRAIESDAAPFDRQTLGAQQISSVDEGKAALIDRLARSRPTALREMLRSIDVQLVVHTELISASADASRLAALIAPGGPKSNEVPRITLDVATTMQRRGHELRLRVNAPSSGVHDPKLMTIIVRAHAARQRLMDCGPTLDPIKRSHLSRIARASYLAPDIVSAIFAGRQPRGLSARRIERGPDLPLCWREQRRVLGFSPG